MQELETLQGNWKSQNLTSGLYPAPVITSESYQIHIHIPSWESPTETRESLLEKQRKKLENLNETEEDLDSKLFLTTTFNPEFNELGNLVQKNWDLLKRSAATKILAENRVVVGY